MRVILDTNVLVSGLISEIGPPASIAPIRDEKDRPFLELAASRPAADYLVTGDKDFENQHYEDIPVISASLFVEKILNPK